MHAGALGDDDAAAAAGAALVVGGVAVGEAPLEVGEVGDVRPEHHPVADRLEEGAVGIGTVASSVEVLFQKRRGRRMDGDRDIGNLWVVMVRWLVIVRI